MMFEGDYTDIFYAWAAGRTSPEGTSKMKCCPADQHGVCVCVPKRRFLSIWCFGFHVHLSIELLQAGCAFPYRFQDRLDRRVHCGGSTHHDVFIRVGPHRSGNEQPPHENVDAFLELIRFEGL